jgi:hypothetical protein
VNKDLLDWLKFAQSETDGVKLNLTQLDAEIEQELALVRGGVATTCN